MIIIQNNEQDTSEISKTFFLYQSSQYVILNFLD